MLTCKDFLRELNDYLDECCDKSVRKEIEKHLSDCPNCFVVADTTRKTVNVYKGMSAQSLPEGLKNRLMSMLESKIKGKLGKCGGGHSAGASTDSATAATSPIKPVE